ncbi:MAG: tetraacyldisaccharide 4'-kinase [Candidatus Omnitrophota bacterium]|nr:tetraacyldisaccharide 4'-kinase [Candidatus Omnitrophota bacterium]MBU1929309.1 tetraacyldisaccharide 4'-kinase [Candidatus Omnitrophota bacterium]MBU2035601.1 tetraacyldisaccharide 4'-kinase [Candidatus Omnitrophota bacterium]MBU2221576.1 tetraacyldisaccharide 4'-kinase [Candidatus Omnitrophota bacterium]MBU2258024.1 tetraacyldisaccharide 4'-kinase [Candidatus Omnitrophota bacterium]
MKRYLYNIIIGKHRGLVPGLIRFFLFILAIIYGLIIRILVVLNSLRQTSLGCRVISVGNITLGGTGKTCLVEFIARFFKSKGKKIAILTRGYKKLAKGQAVNSQLIASSYATMGDEPYMLSKKLNIPVIVGPDRTRSAKTACQVYKTGMVILDDGFQQWGIKKDLEIVVIDATDPFGNFHCLPRGMLREPISALKRADIFVITKVNLNPDIQDIKDFLARINSRAEIFESAHQPKGFYLFGNDDQLLGLDSIKDKNVVVFSGIGDPDSFEELIIRLEAKIGLSFKFSDHHNYTRQDLGNIINQAKRLGVSAIVTTEKDAVRLSGLGIMDKCQGLSFLILAIELKIIKNEQTFCSRLSGILPD